MSEENTTAIRSFRLQQAVARAGFSNLTTFVKTLNNNRIPVTRADVYALTRNNRATARVFYKHLEAIATLLNISTNELSEILDRKGNLKKIHALPPENNPLLSLEDVEDIRSAIETFGPLNTKDLMDVLRLYRKKRSMSVTPPS